jgi:hypothetical protein
MFNGKGEPQITIFFANPFVTDDDGTADVPDWSRLAMWEQIARTCRDRKWDPLNRFAAGFRHS